MAKHLYIIRHAKSDWGFDISDFDRPLNARGLANAPEMAKRLAKHTDQPQLLISSPAKRAITTAELFAEQLGINSNAIQTDERIYEASPLTLMKLVEDLDNGYDHIAIFGHNPGLGALANHLAGENSLGLPTCAVVHLRFDDATGWPMVHGGTGTVAWYGYPKDGE